MELSDYRGCDDRSDSEEDDDTYIEVPDDLDANRKQYHICLFCNDQSSADADDLISQHMSAVHGVDNFGSLLASVGILDQAAWVRLIRYLRLRQSRNKDQAGCNALLPELRQILMEFLKSTANEDPTDGGGDVEMASTTESQLIVDPLMFEVDIEDLVSNSRETTGLVDSLKDQRIKELEDQVESLRSEIAGMSAVLRRFAGCEGSASPPGRSGLPAGRASSSSMPQSARTIADLDDDEDEYYVDSYSGDSIHAEMLKDRIRTGAYHNFIASNADALFKNRAIMDVGCGTGILSMFAAKSGASRVLAVDCADIIKQAEIAAKDNNLADVISFHRGKLEHLDELSDVKVDAIVSEWMGYCLLYEGMLESVLYARDRYLKPGGAVYPRLCDLRLCGLDSEELYQSNALYFDNVYGIRVSYLKELSLAETHIAYDLKPEWVATDSASICRIDMLTAKPTASAQVESAPVILTAKRNCRLHAIVGYFDVDFLGEGDVGNNVQFSTGPLSEVTHWGQTIFYLRKPVELIVGQSLEFKISLGAPKDSPRSLRVVFDWLDGEKESEFLMK